MITKSRVVVLSTALSVVLSAPGAAQDPQASCATLPFNIHVEPLLRSAVAALLQHSKTFKRQCLTIAASRGVRVRVAAVAPRALASSVRAHATITRHEYGMVRAVIEIPIASDYAELIPHEFEHVIEVMEGLNLAQRADEGDDVVEVEGGAFETTRARNAGLAASREVYGDTDAPLRRVWRAISARAVPAISRRAGPASRW